MNINNEIANIIRANKDASPFAALLPSLAGQRVSLIYVPNRLSKPHELFSLPTVPTLGVVNSLYCGHLPQADKHERAVIWGASSGGRRNADIRTIYALQFDFDGTIPRAEVEAMLAARGMTFLMYSSYSQGLKAGDNFRVIVFLAEPIVLHDYEDIDTRIEGIGDVGYSLLYRHVARDLFGAEITDKSCTNAGRIFYLPACPPDAEPGAHVIRYGDGVLYDWRPAWRVVATKADTIRTDIERRRSEREDAPDDEKVEEIAAHLRYLEPETYDDWLLGLMVLHNETDGSDAALAAAHKWSARSDKYDEDGLDDKWRTLGNGGRGIGSLIHRIRKTKPSYLEPVKTADFYEKQKEILKQLKW